MNYTKAIFQIEFSINLFVFFDVPGVTVFLAITVFATIVTDNLPAPNSIPLVGQNKKCTMKLSSNTIKWHKSFHISLKYFWNLYFIFKQTCKTFLCFHDLIPPNILYKIDEFYDKSNKSWICLQKLTYIIGSTKEFLSLLIIIFLFCWLRGRPNLRKFLRAWVMAF